VRFRFDGSSVVQWKGAGAAEGDLMGLGRAEGAVCLPARFIVRSLTSPVVVVVPGA